MRDIEQLIKELIPSNDYYHCRDFTNEYLDLSLDESEKVEIERSLIAMLDEVDDSLIGEALAIMKSPNALPSLKKRLDLAKSPTLKIIWAS